MELNQCAHPQSHKADIRLNAVHRGAIELLQMNLADARQHGDTGQEKYIQAAIAK